MGKKGKDVDSGCKKGKKSMKNKILGKVIAGLIISTMITLNISNTFVFAKDVNDQQYEMNEDIQGINENNTEQINNEEMQQEIDTTEQSGNQDTVCENSWRYKNGELLSAEELDDYIDYDSRARLVAPWTNIDGCFYNPYGDIIPGVVAKGIDVSEHNGLIDWGKVKNTDVNYAIIRCGYGDNLAYQDDKQWSNNVSECERLGIPYGVYIYSYASSVEQAKSEAEHVLRLIAGHSLSYPIYLDLEEESIRSKVSTEKIAQIAKTFCDVIQSAGYPVGIYANYNWFTNYLINPQFEQYSKWVAQYNYQCDYQGLYTMWQCTSSGSIDGINGRVDINLDFGTSGISSTSEKKLIQEDGVTYCYKGTEKLYGEQKVAGKWYYFDINTGAMQTGIVDLGYKIVYYGNDGGMLYGEQRIDGKWYYFDKVTGAMQTGIVNLGHKIVYYGNDGAMLYGEQKIDEKWYCFDKVTGAMQTGFYQLGDKTVYYGNDGAMLYGEQRIDGKWHYFDINTGAMQTGVVNLGHKIVYYGNDGAMLYGEQRIDGKWYYFDKVTGAMQIGIVNLGNKIVYYNSDGFMLYGRQRINEKWYYFDSITGAMQIGFYQLDGKVVYYGNDGAMLYGEQRIDGKWYYFDKVTGAMQTGFYDLGNKTVYYNANGAMLYGEQRINGKWYYFDKVTGAMQIGFVNLGHKTVYYNEVGEMQYGKQVIDEKTYYFDRVTGAMQK